MLSGSVSPSQTNPLTAALGQWLRAACDNRDTKKVIELLSLPTPFDKEDSAVALKYAAQSGNEELLFRLLADPRFDPSREESLLSDSVEEINILQMLLADSRVTTTQVSQALVTACYSTSAEFSAYILLRDSRSDPCYDDCDALVGACLNGMGNIAKALLEAGANPAARNNACIKLACASGDAELVNILLRDERVNAHDSGNFAVKHSWSKNIVELLIESKKIQPKEKDADGKTLLHHACTQGNWEVVKLLANTTGLDPFEADFSGKTPVDFAFEGNFGEYDTLMFLVESVYWTRIRWIWMRMYEDFGLGESGWRPITIKPAFLIKSEPETTTNTNPNAILESAHMDIEPSVEEHKLMVLPETHLNADICRTVAYWFHQIMWAKAEQYLQFYKQERAQKRGNRASVSSEEETEESNSFDYDDSN